MNRERSLINRLHIFRFIIKFGYNACCHSLKERAHESIEHRAELNFVTPSAKCPTFSGTSLFAFAIIESEISDQASWQVGTEEPNKGL